MKQIPVGGVDHELLVEACKEAGIHLAHVDMGTGQQTIVRGVNIGGRLPWQSADADGDEDNVISNQAQRLVQVTWTFDREAAMAHTTSPRECV